MLLCDGDTGTHHASENAKTETDTFTKAQSRHTHMSSDTQIPPLKEPRVDTHTSTHTNNPPAPHICIHGQGAGELTD